MIILQTHQRLVADYRLCGAFQFTSDKVYMKTGSSQCFCMRYRIGHKRCALLCQKRKHAGCRGSGIQIDKILRQNQPCRMRRHQLLGFYIDTCFLFHGRLMGHDRTVTCHCTAEDFHEFAGIVQRCDITAHRGFRSIQKLFYFCHRNTVFLFQ